MTAMNDAELKHWWDDVHSAFMEILYRYDPLDMGSTVGAPDDEYFDEATGTIRSLLDLSDEWGRREAIASRWPGAGDAMLNELEAAWRPPPKAQP
ncbi:MAG: hypothetical protein Q8Q52_07820 [Acidimicrobiia bacterium]|nr:hypothetical protein [Acidimicrobiia bacterium]